MNDTQFESCIKCTVCTTVCPVSGVDPRYPGPKQAGPDGERLRLKDGALYDEALKYCINCKRCEVACPSDVKIGDIIQRARARSAGVAGISGWASGYSSSSQAQITELSHSAMSPFTNTGIRRGGDRRAKAALPKNGVMGSIV